MNKKKDPKEFITACKEKYGDVYSYEKTFYTGSKKNVEVVCVEHGESHFVSPQNFLNAKILTCKCRRSKTGKCGTCGAVSEKSTCERCVAKNKKSNQEAKGLTANICSTPSCSNNCKPDQSFCLIHTKTEAIAQAKAKEKEKVAEVVQKPRAEKRVALDKCIYGDCKSSKKKDGYCGKHFKQGKYEEKIAAGLRPCSMWNRGCPDGFEGYVEEGAASHIKKCTLCRKKSAEKDKLSRIKKAEATVAAVKSEADQIPCVKCKKLHNRDQYEIISKTGERTLKCPSCLAKERIVEANRGKRDRDFKPYENQPRVREMRREWKLKNPEKTKSYYQEYRRRKLQENPEEYLARNATMQKMWRERNPEASAANRIKQRLTLKRILYTYQKEARTKGIKWLLSDDQVEMMCWNNCFYCDKSVGTITIMGEEYDVLNGLDRIDSDGDYDLKNSRPCCKQCNRSKGDLPVKAFLSQCARIVLNLGNDQELEDDIWDLMEMCPFSASPGVPYSRCKISAEKRKLLFDLTREEFDLVKKDGLCYLCGEHAPPGQVWGLDRVDNFEGYTMSNVESCCSSCNYMKADEDVEEFIGRCKSIVEMFAGNVGELPEPARPNRSRNTKRLTVPDKRPISLTTVERKLIIQREKLKVDSLDKGLFSYIECKVSAGTANDEEVEIIAQYNLNVKKALKDAIDAKSGDGIVENQAVKKVDQTGDILQAGMQAFFAKAAAADIILKNTDVIENNVSSEKDVSEIKKSKRRERNTEDELEQQRQQYKTKKGGVVREYKKSRTDEEKRQMNAERVARSRAKKAEEEKKKM